MSVTNKDYIRDQLKEIYIAYRRDMYIKAYSIVKDSGIAEDIVHDAMIKVSGHLSKITDINSNKTRAFMIVLVKNLSIDVIRKKNKTEEVDFELVRMSLRYKTNLLEEGFIRVETIREMASHIDKVNSAYADIIRLKYYHGFEVNEIAQILDMTDNNVRVKMYRALKALKCVIEEGELIDEE